jgi:hypothetical protein
MCKYYILSFFCSYAIFENSSKNNNKVITRTQYSRIERCIHNFSLYRRSSRFDVWGLLRMPAGCATCMSKQAYGARSHRICQVLSLCFVNLFMMISASPVISDICEKFACDLNLATFTINKFYNIFKYGKV